MDVINGTAGNDTIIGEFGANNTLNAGDQIDGRGGIDTLKMYGNFDAAQMPANIKNIQIAHLNATNDADHNFSNWTKAATGIEKWEIANASLLSGRTITTTDNQSLSLATGPGNVATAGAVTWAASANDTTASLILNGYQGGKGVNPDALTITGAATQTIDLNLMSAKSQISTFTLPGTATKMVITGDQSFVVKTDTVGANLAEIDASATTGGVNLAVNGTNANLKFTGGDGNDTVIFGATNTFAETNVLDGKGGSNTLGMRKNEAVNVNSDTKIYGNISNFDTLKITTATANGEFIDLKAFGVKNITFDAAATATTTVRNLNDGAKVSIGDASTAVLNLENVTANDTLNLMTTGAAVTYALTANNFQTINVNTGSATGASTINFTNPQLKTLNLTNQKSDGTYNDHAVVFTTELGVITELVDLTGFKAATAGNGVTVNLNNAAVNGATVKGSDNNDIIQGSNQADTIIAGKGNDIITGRGGNDTIDISAGGQNTVTFSAANVNGLDSITGFQTGTLAGRDVLHIGALGVGQSATLTLVANLTSAAAIGDDSINIVNYAADIAGKNFGGGQFADFFGAGKVLAATMSTTEDALVVVQGTDQTHIYAINNDGTAGIIADEVTLVGILTNTTNAATFHADNFAHA